MSHEPTAELVSLDEASKLLEVTRDRVAALIEEGLLSPAEGSGEEARFSRAEIMAVREMGG